MRLMALGYRDWVVDGLAIRGSALEHVGLSRVWPCGAWFNARYCWNANDFATRVLLRFESSDCLQYWGARLIRFDIKIPARFGWMHRSHIFGYDFCRKITS